MIKQIYRKVKRFFGTTTDKNDNSSYLEIPSDSVLLNGTRFDFRFEKENRKYIEIGKKCLVKATFTFETPSGFISIGNNVHLGGVHFICRTGIKIDNDVTMAWGITIYDHDSHSIHWEHRKNDNIQCYQDFSDFNGNNIVNKDWSNVISKSIHIKSKVWIGFGVIILKGVTIGEGAVIGAGSVVTKDVPDWSVIAGNPARVVKVLK
ncbi:MAG: acyltransferase [Bacteroidota bacterium]